MRTLPLPLAVLSCVLTACAPAPPPDDEGLPDAPATEADAEIDESGASGDDEIDEEAGEDTIGAPVEDDTETPIEDDAEAPIEDDTEAPIGDDTEAPIEDDTEPPIEDDNEAPIDDEAEPSDALDGDKEGDDGSASADATSFPRRTYLLPFTCGKRVLVTQGNNTNFSHQGTSRWAYDFKVKRGTRVRAMKNGRVIFVRRATQPGDACYDGGGPECRTKANYVVLKHRDGSSTMYAHLQSVRVHVGDRVKRGDVLGRSGNTGYSTGPHLHVARQQLCGSSHCQSIRLKFGDVGGDHMPNTGQRVRSKNGCD